MTVSEIKFIENVTETTEDCRYCLMCRHTCPVGHAMRLETLTPHGWGLVIASVKRGLLEWNEETVNILYSCADCGNCRSNCVTDRPLPEAIAAARAEVVDLKRAPQAVYDLDAALRQYGNPYQQQTPDPASGSGEIALFVGDEARYLSPATLDAALRLLEAVGVRPVLIGVGRSSGYLASSLGLPETAAQLARATLEELAASGAARMLVLSPGDYFAFSRMHTERHGLAWPAGVALQEVSVLLAEALQTGRLTLKQSADVQPYAYLDPTHSARTPERYAAPRTLLTAVMPGPAREAFWREQRTHAVGSTALQFTQPGLSAHLTIARLQDAAASGARLLFTDDPGTLHHLSRYGARFGLTITGLYEHLAAHLI